MAAEIKNIIFDLGGVLLNIEPGLTGKVLTEMGAPDMESLHARLMERKLYQRFDSGICSSDVFRQEIREVSGLPLTDVQIDEAWNALLLDFPAPRVELLHQLHPQYNLYLLSNTNPIHFESYTRTFREVHGEEMPDLFDRLFLSYELGAHKPDPEIYQKTIAQGNLLPQETLFIDDSLANVQAATRAGLIGFHLSPGLEVTALFINRKLRMDAEFLLP